MKYIQRPKIITDLITETLHKSLRVHGGGGSYGSIKVGEIGKDASVQNEIFPPFGTI